MITLAEPGLSDRSSECATGMRDPIDVMLAILSIVNAAYSRRWHDPLLP
jgi:hypothetical protein